MKIKNTKKTKKVASISAARLNNIMANNVLSDFLTFDDIRQAEGKTAEQLSDGAIHQAALDAGLTVEI
ncbi:MAG: hypothetical protein KBT88_03495 [Gammaproteobacteria bacterium]|nr:hypothetical protein [Gammaproteobacteria bacterium]MBQ0838825.1 hypothetical protein [Gammaproteobacteria bacterium]